MKTLFATCLVLLMLGGCKQNQEQTEADKWKHAKTLETQIQINKDNLWSIERLAKSAQKHARIMADKFVPVIKFALVIGAIGGVVWSGLRYYWRWSIEKLVQEFRIKEVTQEQITLRQKNKLAMGYIFDPVVFELLSKEERKIVFDGLGKPQQTIPKIEAKTPFNPQKHSWIKGLSDFFEQPKVTENDLKKVVSSYQSKEIT